MRINKSTKWILIFLFCALMPSGDNHSMHLIAEEGLLIVEEVGLLVAATLGAWLSMHRQARIDDPSQARLHKMSLMSDREARQMTYNVNQQEVLKSYKHIAEQYHKPVYKLPAVDKKAVVTAAGNVFNHLLSDRADAKTAATGAIIVIEAANNPAVRAEINFSNFVQGRQAHCAARFAQLQQAHFTNQFENNLHRAAIEKSQLNAAFRNLRALASKSVTDAAGVRDEGVAHIELARQKMESIRELCLDLPKISTKGHEFDYQTFLLKYDQAIARYNDPEFTMIMRELFGDVMSTISFECFDKTGMLKCPEDKNIVLAKCLAHMSEHKNEFEFLFKGQAWSKFKNQDFDYHNLARLASEKSGIQLYILNNLYDNKLINLYSPKIADEFIEKIKTNPANCIMRNLKYALDQSRLLDAKKICDECDEQHRRGLIPYDIYHMACSAYNAETSSLEREYGIAPYIENPLWQNCTSEEQLTILQDSRLAHLMGRSLQAQYEALVRDISAYYRFPSMTNLTQKECTAFEQLTHEILYNTPKQRNDRFLNIGCSKDEKYDCIKKYLFMPNGILRAHSDNNIARNFTLDPAKREHVYRITRSFNQLLSFDSEQSEVKQLVDVGIAALVRANYTTGYEFFDYLELAESVERCLDGNPHYQPLKNVKLEYGKLQEAIGLMQQCAQEERAALNRVALDNDVIKRIDAKTHEEAVALLARDYHLPLDHKEFLSLLASHPQIQHASLVRSIFQEYHSGQASPKMVALYNALYSENKILRAFDNYEWVKTFKLNPSHSAEFQQQSADLANQLLIRYRDTGVIRNLAELAQITADNEQINILEKKIDEGLECIAQANNLPDEALYFNSLASQKLHEIDTIVSLYPAHTEYLYPQAVGQSDFFNAYEIGPQYTTFKSALDTLHIHFNPTYFTESEVSAADKAYADIFGSGIFWKGLCDNKKYPYTNIELNTQLHPHVQEAIILTGSRLLAVRTDVENVQHVNRALRYVERANTASGDDAEVYLKTAQAIYNGLNVNSTYKQFLDVDLLSEDASLESHRLLLEQCAKEEELQLKHAISSLSPLRKMFKGADTGRSGTGSKHLPGLGGKPVRLPGGIVISPPKADPIGKLQGLCPPQEEKPGMAEPGIDVQPGKIAKPDTQPGKVKKPRLVVEEGEEEIYDAGKENIKPGVTVPEKAQPGEKVKTPDKTKPGEREEAEKVKPEGKIKNPEKVKPEEGAKGIEGVKGIIKSPRVRIEPTTEIEKNRSIEPPAQEPQKLLQLGLENIGAAVQWPVDTIQSHETQMAAQRMSNALEKELKRLNIKARKFRLTPKDIEHVECGIYSVKRGHIEGGHICPMHNGEILNILNIKYIGDQGVYEGKPYHPDFRNLDMKTFFPNGWSISKVMNEMSKVIKKGNIIPLKPLNPAVARFLVVLENGIKVELRTSPNGITFFPQY